MIPLLLACVLASARSVAASAVAADAPRPGQVVTKVAPPEVLTRVRPSIPPAAANGLWDETAIVSAQIGDDGRVKGVRIIRSVPQLDAAVCAAVQKWLFRPPRDEDGNPQSIAVTIPLRFARDHWVGVGWVDRPPQPRKPPAVIEFNPAATNILVLETLHATVIAHVLVGEDGRVVESRVVKSIPILDAFAESTAARTSFVPAIDRGRPVRAWAAPTLRFRFR